MNLISAILPALFLVIYFYKKDSAKREPVSLIWKVFLLGFFSVLPAAAIEIFLEPFAGLSHPLGSAFARAFLIAGLVEEGIKLAAVRFYVYKKPDFDEITDGIVYTVTAAMGFACFENILYSTGGTITVLLRAFTAVPLHAIASGIMGYYVGLEKFGRKNSMAKGLAAAVLVHGLYDFLLFTNTLFGLLVIPLLIISWLHLRRLLGRAVYLDRASGRS